MSFARRSRIVVAMTASIAELSFEPACDNEVFQAIPIRLAYDSCL